MEGTEILKIILLLVGVGVGIAYMVAIGLLIKFLFEAVLLVRTVRAEVGTIKKVVHEVSEKASSTFQKISSFRSEDKDA